MKIYFDIQYKTAFGEELLLNVEGQDESADSVLMFTRDGLNWSCDIDVQEDTTKVSYYYSVRNYRGIKRTEWKMMKHLLYLNATATNDTSCTTDGTTSPATLISTARHSPTASTDALRER